MSLPYDEIVIKYVEGGLLKNLSWLLQNLEKDPEIIAGTSREKENLQKLLTMVRDQFDEFLGDGDDNRSQQDDAELFGDDDVVVGPGGTQTTFMDPPTDGDDSSTPDAPPSEDEDDAGPSFDTGADFDDGFPK